MQSMVEVTESGARLDQLEQLARVLAETIDCSPDPKSLAQLSRQYRETIKEIEEIKGVNVIDDEIGEILSERKADGKPGAVRKSRS